MHEKRRKHKNTEENISEGSDDYTQGSGATLKNYKDYVVREIFNNSLQCQYKGERFRGFTR